MVVRTPYYLGELMMMISLSWRYGELMMIRLSWRRYVGSVPSGVHTSRRGSR